MKCLSPLRSTQGSIYAHGLVIFILVAQGMLLVLRPDLLLTGSDLARLYLCAHRVLACACNFSCSCSTLCFKKDGPAVIVKIGSMLFWLAYAVMFGKALLSQTAR